MGIQTSGVMKTDTATETFTINIHSYLPCHLSGTLLCGNDNTPVVELKHRSGADGADGADVEEEVHVMKERSLQSFTQLSHRESSFCGEGDGE